MAFLSTCFTGWSAYQSLFTDFGIGTKPQSYKTILQIGHLPRFSVQLFPVQLQAFVVGRVVGAAVVAVVVGVGWVVGVGGRWACGMVVGGGGCGVGVGHGAVVRRL